VRTASTKMKSLTLFGESFCMFLFFSCMMMQLFVHDSEFIVKATDHEIKVPFIH
jgi:hypothetical protein